MQRNQKEVLNVFLVWRFECPGFANTEHFHSQVAPYIEHITVETVKLVIRLLFGI